MDIDALVREVMDLRKSLDEAARDIARLMAAKRDTVSSFPPAPFAPTIEDFNALGLNNDSDADGA